MVFYKNLVKRLINCYPRIAFWYQETFRPSKPSAVFNLGGNLYPYFYHRYNCAYANERTVEIPVVWEIVKKYQGKAILEAGNVLSHYFPVSHDILDKYEKANGIINQDVVDFQSDKKYDLIISISTLEHVGWDEHPHQFNQPPDTTKVIKAIETFKKYLNHNGEIVITIPLGWNTALDKLIDEGKIQFKKMYCLKRISRTNKWKETDYNDIRGMRYGNPYPYANGLIIGFMDKK